MLLLFCYLLGCAPLLAANPVGTPPIVAAAPVGTPPNSLVPAGATQNAAAPPLAAAPNSTNRTGSPPAAPLGTPSNATEQEALLALRAGWQDPRGYLANWSASNLPWCSWWGVTCTNSSVTSIYLSGLSLSGTISPAIANLSSLSTLNLASNKLSGSIPPELGSLPSLITLQLGYNSFSGSIPGTLFLSPSLQFLHLENNSLSGEVPSTIANLVHLRYLSLQFNSLTGPIPASITNLIKLSTIQLGYNRLNGTIPLQIGDLNRLIYLNLQDNLLTGPIPSSIGSLTKLRELVLRENQLGGPLPAELGELHDAIVIDLSYNSFNGTIPPEIGSLSSLQRLDLCENDLAGIIPATLGNLTMLKALNMSYNNLSGEVPINGVLADFNATSFAGNKFLCGDPMSNPTCSMPPGKPMAPGNYMNPGRMPYNNPSQFGKNEKVTIAVVVGAFGLVVVFVILVFCSCRKTARKQEYTERIENSFSLDVADSMRKAKLEVYMQGLTHNYEQIVSHAGYYDTAHVIGKGRFATVYRADLPGGKQLAVKVFKNPITQTTFEREMASLQESAGHVSTLLPIRGYYSNPIEKAILYDFMPKGTLHDVLHGAPTLLDWSKRLTIALGAAQALAHLHKGSNLKALHKDFKSSNVLLDDDLCPLVADYGLIELVSKSIVQTPGYAPPEFLTLSSSSKRYTEKTDVYSFGVVLLELLTSKSPVSYIGPNTEVSQIEPDTEVPLVTWALSLHMNGQGLEVLDPFVVESCPSPDLSIQALNLAIHCLNDEPSQRPTMSETTSILERLASNNSPMRDTPKRPLLK